MFFLIRIKESKIDSYDSFPLKKKLTMHKAVRLFYSVLNKNKNHYYYNMFLEKSSYHFSEKNGNKYYTQVFLD